MATFGLPTWGQRPTLDSFDPQQHAGDLVASSQGRISPTEADDMAERKRKQLLNQHQDSLLDWKKNTAGLPKNQGMLPVHPGSGGIPSNAVYGNATDRAMSARMNGTGLPGGQSPGPYGNNQVQDWANEMGWGVSPKTGTLYDPAAYGASPIGKPSEGAQNLHQLATSPIAPSPEFTDAQNRLSIARTGPVDQRYLDSGNDRQSGLPAGMTGNTRRDVNSLVAGIEARSANRLGGLSQLDYAGNNIVHPQLPQQSLWPASSPVTGQSWKGGSNPLDQRWGEYPDANPAIGLPRTMREATKLQLPGVAADPKAAARVTAMLQQQGLAGLPTNATNDDLLYARNAARRVPVAPVAERQARVSAKASGQPIDAAQAHFQVAHPQDAASWAAAGMPPQASPEYVGLRQDAELDKQDSAELRALAQSRARAGTPDEIKSIDARTAEIKAQQDTRHGGAKPAANEIPAWKQVLVPGQGADTHIKAISQLEDPKTWPSASTYGVSNKATAMSIGLALEPIMKSGSVIPPEDLARLRSYITAKIGTDPEFATPHWYEGKLGIGSNISTALTQAIARGDDPNEFYADWKAELARSKDPLGLPKLTKPLVPNAPYDWRQRAPWQRQKAGTSKEDELIRQGIDPVSGMRLGQPVGLPRR